MNKFSLTRFLPVLLGGALLAIGTAPAWAGDAGSLLGSGLGAAAGAAIGQQNGGRNGAVIGGAVGGAAGAAVTTRGSGQGGAIVGGALGGAAGAAVGQQAGGANGAIIGAGAGAAVGSTLGRGMTEQSSRPMQTREGVYYRGDDGRREHGHHDKHGRCYEEHPGRGHAYGKYKDCR